MPSTRDIRRRIKSVKNTAQITKAMQMVASAKMRKAQQAALAGRPYASLMNEVLAAATAGAGEFQHPLAEKREVKKRALILISTDKGLCGALNTNLLREATRLEPGSTVFICAGKKGGQWAARLKLATHPLCCTGAACVCLCPALQTFWDAVFPWPKASRGAVERRFTCCFLNASHRL